VPLAIRPRAERATTPVGNDEDGRIATIRNFNVTAALKGDHTAARTNLFYQTKSKLHQTKESIRAMQTMKTAALTPERADSPVLQKRIGSTTYVVNVRFCEEAKETLEQKLLRLMEREAGEYEYTT
jgi:hypothetical protein